MSRNCYTSRSENRTPRSHNSAIIERPQPHLMAWLSPPTVIECKKPALADQGDCQVETEFTPLNGAAHVHSYLHLERSISSMTEKEIAMGMPMLICRPPSFDPESDTGQCGLWLVLTCCHQGYCNDSTKKVIITAQ